MPTEPSPDTQAAIELALASKAPATVRAYEADWRHFTAWCASRGHTPLPAQPPVIAAYQAANYLPNPCKSPEVQATWHGIRRELGWSKNRATPATTSVLRQLADTCDTERYIGLRDRAMLLLGFAALLRRSEVVALDVSDLVLVPEGLEVRVDHPVDRGERDPEPRIDIRAVPYGDHPETCPVRAWFAWRAATGLDDGPAFRPVHPRARVGHYPTATIQRALRLTDLAVYRAVQSAARRAGLETPLRYRGHSLRAGAAVQAGPVATDQELMEAGGWASLEVVRSYTGSTRIWEDPVAGRLGARRLAAAGAEVTVLDRDADGAKRVAHELEGRVLVVDLAGPDLDTLRVDTDILVNNAGLQHVAPVQEFPPERFALLLRVMLEAPFRLARAALPGMYERGWGRIVNISSVHGLRASPFKSAYVAAKHGLEGLSKVIALEGGPQGVTSNCICPAYVRTPLVESQIADQARVHGISEDEVVATVMLTEPAIKRLVEPEEVAELAAFLCSEPASFVNGASMTMDGGWSAR